MADDFFDSCDGFLGEFIEEEKNSVVNKYDNAKDKLQCDGFIKFPNAFFTYKEFGENEIGLFAIIQSLLTNMKVNDLSLTPMTSSRNLLVSIGIRVNKNNMEHVDSALEKLMRYDLVKKLNTKMVGKEEYFQLAVKECKKNFTIVELHDIYKIIGKSEKINVLSRIALYISILSYIFNSDTSDDDGVCIKSREVICKRAGITASSYRRYVIDLCDWEILAYFLIHAAAPANYKKKIFSKFENREKLISYVQKKLKSGQYINVIE